MNLLLLLHPRGFCIFTLCEFSLGILRNTDSKTFMKMHKF